LDYSRKNTARKLVDIPQKAFLAVLETGEDEAKRK
jgi:hypothetical protein